MVPAMFYDPRRNDHGLPRDPFKSLIVPRPIGWISTVGADGIVNLAPYSFFNGVSEEPPMVMFAPGGRKPDRPFKDSQINAEATGEFVVNLATYDLRDKMNATSTTLPAEVDEFAYAGLTPVPSRNVRPPRVAESPIHLECRYHRTIELPASPEGEPNCIVIGEVVGIHIRDDLIRNGRVDIVAARPIARLGYSEYTTVDNKFRMLFPDLMAGTTRQEPVD
jgi:flavin reductase (DIM6/NTAB) family NADH-FMN oxidoreductase RutF